jgi:hypothetical protein
MRDAPRNRRSRPLEVEPMEPKLLLSGANIVSVPPAPEPLLPILRLPLPIIVGLSGTAHGSYTSSQKVPDVGTSYTVSASGTFTTYGKAAVSGSLQTPGFIATGKATGTLNLAFVGGTLTLALTGPTEKGFGGLPSEFSFVITKGTGRFHNSVGDPVGKGTVDVSITPGATGTALSGHGLITLTFHPGIVVVL